MAQPAALPPQYWTTPFSDSASFYDAIYTGERDYSQQADRVAVLLLRLNPSTQTLLDVACGTGLHIEQLRRRFHCEGLVLQG